MKTLKLFLALAIIGCLYSCQSTPIIGATTSPFVVYQIKDIGGNLSEYCGGRESAYNTTAFTMRPAIVLPTGCYNIGDTIIIHKR